jgi:hypothetical protein
MEARGVISMVLTVVGKSLATAFFIVKVQGNYSVILGRDWIHANRCIPSTLHQFLIQWIDNEIEVVHAEASAYIALPDATADLTTWGRPVHIRKGCYKLRLSWRLQGRFCARVCEADFRSSAQQCSVPMSTQKNVKWLHHRTEQYQSITNDMCEAIEDFDKVEKLG